MPHAAVVCRVICFAVRKSDTLAQSSHSIRAENACFAVTEIKDEP